MPIFYPFRALGYITDSTPPSIQIKGSETFLKTTVGKSWQSYNCAKLSLVFAGPQLKKRINATASFREYTFAASGQDIFVFKSSTEVNKWSGHTEKIILLFQFGSHILSIGKDRRVLAWPIPNPETVTEPAFAFSLEENFTPTCVCHPETYLNKILIGSEEGRLQLWNISTQKLIYEFQSFHSPITCLASSPALDTIAVGCENGKISVFNIKYDEILFSFMNTTKGSVTSLSFRSDGQPFLASGNSFGFITIWNLSKRKLHTLMNNAHDAAVTWVFYMPNEPILISSGADNAIKMWIFDSNDDEPRLLRFRSGHSAPPSCLKYYGNGLRILSAGQDRAFRLFSTIQDQQSRELSQGKITGKAKKMKIKEEYLKLSRVVNFAAAEIRERDWSNVVTCHEGKCSAYTWQLTNFVIGDKVLTPPNGGLYPVNTCCISSCGNFAIIGTAEGRIEKFNLQSGLHRLTFKRWVEGKKDGKKSLLPHKGEIIALDSDLLNLNLFSSGYDGFIRIWDFKTGELKTSISVNCPIAKMCYHRPNGLLAIVSDDLVIRVFDTISVNLVRRFEGHTDRITDMCYSEDGRWLLTCSMDKTLRVWDLVNACQLDCMMFDHPPTGLTFSPDMDMLATIHSKHNGIYLWANRIMYSGINDTLNFGSGKQIEKTNLPSISFNSNQDQNQSQSQNELTDSVEKSDIEDLNSGSGSEKDKIVDSDNSNSIRPLCPELVTLSLLPPTTWRNLINLDIIKARNKPIEPPKKPELAPFFLPTISSLSGEAVFAIPSKDKNAQNDKKDPASDSKVLRKSQTRDFGSEFSRLLAVGKENGNYSSALSLLKELNPSAIDLELTMLQINTVYPSDDELTDLQNLFDFLIQETNSKTNFEFIQAIIHRTLTIHGESVTQFPSIKKKASELLEIQANAWEKLDELFQNIRCVSSFLSNSQL